MAAGPDGMTDVNANASWACDCGQGDLCNGTCDGSMFQERNCERSNCGSGAGSMLKGPNCAQNNAGMGEHQRMMDGSRVCQAL